jgi:ribulose-5-phosphate 4-epimerase/fuculose-1-phosphate aldolase
MPSDKNPTHAKLRSLQTLKKKLILANKILESERLATPFGHVSVRIPGRETFLITRSIAPATATLNDILVCDLNGKILQGKYQDTYSEVVIHTGVYKKRKEFQSVIHSHSSYVIALSMAGMTVHPANIQAANLGPEPIALYPRMLFIDKPDLGEEVADLLGPNRAVILKGHGAVIAGHSIEEAIYGARILETSAMSQWMARCVGPLASPTEEEKGILRDFHERVERKGHGSFREWTYYESKLTKRSK